MERTRGQWQAIGKVLAHGICPGDTVQDSDGDVGTVPEIDKWEHGMTGRSVLFRDSAERIVWLYSAFNQNFAMVIDQPQSLSGKEVSVTIDGQTYTAIIK